MNIIILVLFVVLMLFNCCQVKDRDFGGPWNFTDTLATFRKEIPTYQDGPSSGDTSFLFKATKKDASQLRLDYIENGFDRLQIRVCLGHSMAIERDLIILKLHDSIWEANHISFTANDNDNIEKRKINKVTPRSGWQEFTKTLSNRRIFELLYETDVNDHAGCGGADGMIYYYEIATTKKYRFLYNCYPDDRFIDFAALLEKEFEFEYLKD